MVSTRSGLLTGTIFIRGASWAFPDDAWNDFILPLLSNWVAQLTSLSTSGQTVQLLFMDGPFVFTIADDGSYKCLGHGVSTCS